MDAGEGLGSVEDCYLAGIDLDEVETLTTKKEGRKLGTASERRRAEQGLESTAGKRQLNT